MAASQLNIRIDAQLKSDVDAALGAMGRSSTDTIRILWRFIQAHAGNLQQVDAALRQLESAARIPTEPAARKPWLEVDAIYAQGLAGAGIDDGALLPAEDDQALYLQAALERLEERGLHE